MRDQNAHMPGLDLLRGLAILLVLFRHIPEPQTLQGNAVADVVAFLNRIGWCGVDLFFVISGFLVTGSILDSMRPGSKFRASQFLLRRAFKIHPSYLAMVLVSWTLVALLFGRTMAWSEVWPQVLLVQNYFYSWLPHTWSLAVEEHFYLLLSFSFSTGILGAGSIGRARVALLILASGGLLVRLVNAITVPFALESHIYPTHLRLDALFVGVYLAYCVRDPDFKPRRGAAYLIFGVAVLLLAIADLSSAIMSVAGLPVLSAASFFLVHSGAHGAFGRVRWLEWVGRASYSIYLWHWGVRWVILTLEISNLSKVLSFFGASIFVGFVMHAFLEQPFLRLRSRLLTPVSQV